MLTGRKALFSKYFAGLLPGNSIGAPALRPEPPSLGESWGSPGPKSHKKKESQKESFRGSAKKSLKIPEEVKKYPKLDFWWGYFLTFSGIFGDFFADPQTTLCETLL